MAELLALISIPGRFFGPVMVVWTIAVFFWCTAMDSQWYQRRERRQMERAARATRRSDARRRRKMGLPPIVPYDPKAPISVAVDLS